ncbi:hypothetical protein QTH91_02740 [Variovorax dokdonensis]|uniref:Surface-adhesin protein E-like domain-containing protein n=1 Tax=Variovorax dokdonensis TaxID=344883 RepID=A0ABT7N622_9BURK|nr:surface-adhesin E family protein [Variovorax dokdonensis]MDM0043388.1 hypothetical protein [Variovorax dokdonensis]
MIAASVAPVGAQTKEAPPAPAWFTVAGDAFKPQAETVQVDLSAIQLDGDSKTLNLRVNRANERQNWEGEPYRSYLAQVRVDCRANRAHYLQVDFYRRPLWEGEVQTRRDYRAKPPPMEFKGMEPNPTERIIRAACRAAA